MKNIYKDYSRRAAMTLAVMMLTATMAGAQEVTFTPELQPSYTFTGWQVKPSFRSVKIDVGEYTVYSREDDAARDNGAYITYGTNIDAGTEAGKLYVRVYQNGSFNDYTIRFDIDPKEVTVVVDNKEKYYGDPDPTFTCHLDESTAGDVQQDTVSNWKNVLARGVRLPREAGELPGTYTVPNATPFKFCGPNVLVTSVTPGTLTVTVNPADWAETATDEYTIYTATGWNYFCDLLASGTSFTGKTVKLGGDISVTRMAGSNDHKFTGTFNGQGNTLTINYGSAESPITEDYAAPFRYMDGGSIENLRVCGDIYTSNKHAAGLIADQYGQVTISNCRSSVTIHSSVSGDGTHGGFVGQTHSTSGHALTIEGCLFDGSLLGPQTTKCGGFIGWSGSTATISNSLFAPADVTVLTDGSATLGRVGDNNMSIVNPTNTYYTQTLGTVQGKQRRSITADENVTVANAGTVTNYSVSGITSYGTGIKYGDVLYAGADDQMSLTLSNSAPEGYAFDCYTVSPDGATLSGSDNPYTLTMPDEDVIVTATWAKVYNLGNCWHVPEAAQPAGTYMRNPIHPYASFGVSIYNGNQAYGDGGNPGDQSGGTIYYRAAGATAWQTAAMEYNTAIENNKYWRGTIPADEFAAASTVEYVIKVTYNDSHDDTYLGLAAAGDVASMAFGTLEEAAAHPFTFTYAGEAGQEPAFVWHGGNAVKMSGTSVQMWVKTGYIVGDKAWVDQAQIRYTVVAPGQAGTELDKVIEMRFDHAEEDPSGIGKAMWWTGTVYESDLAAVGAVLRYQIAARLTTEGGGNGTWHFAEYPDGNANTVFEFAMTEYGADALTVNGQVANYTTSKFFIDESKGETAVLEVVYSPEVSEPYYAVEIYSNVGRRDFWNADIDNDGVADAIRPPSGDLITPETTNSYFAAIPMEWNETAQVWKKRLEVGKTGAYRLTVRYKVTESDSWHYYSGGESGIRDHAVVISPKKVLEQNVYELNGMTVKASAANMAGHSTFADLIEGEDGYAEFGIPYLNNIGANCLWLQPIHTSSELDLAEGDEPGDPYLTKDLFSVSKWYGKNGTTASALSEFQSFVSACDAGKSPNMSTSKVGTINVMLDAVFNHTSIDAVFGEIGEQMGIAGATATTAIASVKPGWYANCNDYGSPATWYMGPAPGQHDIACAPDRGDIRKWPGTAELFYGDYSALVRHNPDDNGNYLNEGDKYDYASMTSDTEELWEYMGSYIPYWLDKTGHDFGNNRMGQTDTNGTAYDDYGIDGLRCDFAGGLPPQFWEYCINRARAKKWNFMFVADSPDGGKVSARNNRQFDILDDSFASAASNAGSPSELFAVIDDMKASYNGGAVLLNLASHDEPMPYSDPWKTASRYAMLATVKGAPMTFYGQEQGIRPLEWGSDGFGEGAIVQPDAPWTGFTKLELRSGKWIPDFTTWNKLTIWDDSPMDAEASHGMAQLYGQINRARQTSPALQSDVQWMLDLIEGYPSTDVWAMAKAEEKGALANGKDAVLAFVLFVNDTHYATSQTFSIPEGAANMLGLEAGKSYAARNLAAADPERVLWVKSTEKLTTEGVCVNFTADENGSAFFNDGAMVYFLKLEEATNLTLLNDDSSQDAYDKNSQIISDAASDGGKFNVTLQDRTLYKDGAWNTLCLPFDVEDGDDTDELTFSGTPLAGATLMELDNSDAVYNYGNGDSHATGLNNGILYLNFKDATSITAGKPYIIRWGTPENHEGGVIEDPVFSGVTITSTTPSAKTSSDSKVTFVGQYSPFEIVASGATGVNQGNQNEIILLGSDNTLGYAALSSLPRTLHCFRAHFEVPANGGSGVKAYQLKFGNEETETGIMSLTEMKNEQGKVNNEADAWYDLSGRKLDGKPTKKGIYINNGRKVAIK